MLINQFVNNKQATNKGKSTMRTGHTKEGRPPLAVAK